MLQRKELAASRQPPRPRRECRGRAARAQRGFSLLETAVTLAVISVVVTALLTTLASASTVTDNVYDRSVLFELAQTQMEDVQRQTFQTSPASYTLVTAPSGYLVSVTSSAAVTYTYPAPLSMSAQETVQLVTVNVTGVRGNFTLQGYKVRR